MAEERENWTVYQVQAFNFALVSTDRARDFHSSISIFTQVLNLILNSQSHQGHET